MSTRRRILAIACGVIVLVVGLVAIWLPRSPSKPIVIKFSHVVSEDAPKHKAALLFKKLVESRTEGQVRVEVFPNAQLYKDNEEMQALQLGAVQMLAPSLSKFRPLGINGFEVFDLPYLFDSYEDLRKVTDGPIGRALLHKLEDKGIVGLAYWDNGFKVMSANKPLRLPVDFRGLKMRIQSSNVLDTQMRALGAIPHKMAFSEVYRALETGLVDGTENPPSNLYTKKMYEVQKYVTVSNHGYLGYAVIANKKFWDSLPWRIRRILESAMADATTYANSIAKQENEAALEAVRASGKCQVLTLSDAEKRAWKEALIPVHTKMKELVGEELLNDIYETTGFYSDKH